MRRKEQRNRMTIDTVYEACVIEMLKSSVNDSNAGIVLAAENGPIIA
jgi:hypothetical protein